MAQALLAQLKDDSAKFADVLAFIEARYQHTPTAFQNGAQFNAATENQGSAKVFSFAKLEGLNQQDTLKLFAEHLPLYLPHLKQATTRIFASLCRMAGMV